MPVVETPPTTYAVELDPTSTSQAMASRWLRIPNRFAGS